MILLRRQASGFRSKVPGIGILIPSKMYINISVLVFIELNFLKSVSSAKVSFIQSSEEEHLSNCNFSMKSLDFSQIISIF
jgi:hypothetical protein